MVDLFDEVEESLRSDRYRSLALRLAPWVSGVLILALVAALGVWGWQTWQNRQIDQASVDYDAAAQLLQQGDQTGAFSRFGEIARRAPPAYATLALMQQGGIRLQANHPEEAVTLFDQAARKAPNQMMADWIALRSVYVLLDTAAYPDLERRITPLTANGRPFRGQALEALATAKLMAGRNAEARRAYQSLRLDLSVTPDIQQRAAAAIQLIDSGQAAQLRAQVRAAATMPPPSAANPALPGGAPPQGPPQAQPGTAQ